MTLVVNNKFIQIGLSILNTIPFGNVWGERLRLYYPLLQPIRTVQPPEHSRNKSSNCTPSSIEIAWNVAARKKTLNDVRQTKSQYQVLFTGSIINVTQCDQSKTHLTFTPNTEHLLSLSFADNHVFGLVNAFHPCWKISFAVYPPRKDAQINPSPHIQTYSIFPWGSNQSAHHMRSFLMRPIIPLIHYDLQCSSYHITRLETQKQSSSSLVTQKMCGGKTSGCLTNSLLTNSPAVSRL